MIVIHNILTRATTEKLQNGFGAFTGRSCRISGDPEATLRLSRFDGDVLIALR